jgi:Domain of unknown function (DUF4157)
MLLSGKTRHTSKDNAKLSTKYDSASVYQKQSKSRDTLQERKNSEFPDISDSLRAVDTGDIGTFRKNPKLAMPLQQTIGNRGVQRLLLPLQDSPHRPIMSSPSDIVHGKKGIGDNNNTNKNSNSNRKRQEEVASRGKSLDSGELKYMEGKFGHDFSNVNVHTDKPAAETARSMHADAFTTGREIYFAQGKYNPSTREGKRLLAHELTHVIQQSRSSMRPSSPQLSPADGPVGTDQAEMEAEISAENVVAEEGATKAGVGAEETTGLKTVVDLQGITNFEQATDFKAIDEFITQQDKAKGMINIRFGSLAEGQMELKKNKRSKEYSGKAVIPLIRHPLLPVPALTEGGPSLHLEIAKNSEIQGQVSFGKENFSALVKRNNPDILRLLGLQELDLKGVSVKNSIEAGNLKFGLENFSFSLGKLLSGSGTIIALNDKFTFQASADVNVRGLDKGHMNFERDEASGAIKGRADLAVTLQEGKFSGNVTANYDAGIITGEGKIGYKSEKFSGQVTLRLSDENEAVTAASTQEKKILAPASAKGLSKGRESKKKPNYVVSGDGVLDFAFNEWLTGSANVIVDPNGYLTVIGKITPAAEVILFEEKAFRKELAKLEARAAYGIPVIGNIFVAAGVELILWGKIGPGKLYKIEVEGEYSTDPKARQKYSIQASLNISAAAGATLRGEGKAGIEILAHDLAIGVGVNGTLGVKGYVEATPVIGYREEGEGDQDKKGVYFISGDIEIAAMPFFSLSGDIFIELDSPFISPLPDKIWKWELGDKEWPLGGSFGIRASVEHIVGSGQWPSIEFQEVDFSPEKFLTDLVEEKAAPSGQALAEQAGKWKEKNTKDAPVPEAVPAVKGGVQEGGGLPAQPPAKMPALPAPKRKKEKKPGPSELAPKGETKQEQEASYNALKKQKRELEKAMQKKGPQLGKEKAGQEKFDKEKQDEQQKEKKEKWEKGVAVINQALAHAEETGISEDELKPILKSIRKQYGFKELYHEDEKTEFAIYASMSPAQQAKKLAKKITTPEEFILYVEERRKSGKEVPYKIFAALHEAGKKNITRAWMETISWETLKELGKKWKWTNRAMGSAFEHWLMANKANRKPVRGSSFEGELTSRMPDITRANYWDLKYGYAKDPVEREQVQDYLNQGAKEGINKHIIYLFISEAIAQKHRGWMQKWVNEGKIIIPAGRMIIIMYIDDEGKLRRLRPAEKSHIISGPTTSL